MRFEPVGQAALFGDRQAAEPAVEVERVVGAFDHRLVDAVERAVGRRVLPQPASDKPEREGERGSAACLFIAIVIVFTFLT